MQCFFSPGKRVVIATVGRNNRTQFEQQTLQEVQVRFPDARQASFSEATQQIEKYYIDKTPTETTKAEFYQALGRMPPEDRKHSDDTESFKMAEYIYGDVTRIYARIGNRYFTFRAKFTLSHQKIIDKCIALSIFENKA